MSRDTVCHVTPYDIGDDGEGGVVLRDPNLKFQRST